MKQIFFMFMVAMAVMSCNHEQIEVDSQRESQITVNQVLEKTLNKLEKIGVYVRKAQSSSLRSSNDCPPTLEGDCITYTVTSSSENEPPLVNTISVPGANGRPSCDAVNISYDLILCVENFVITSVTITNFETSIDYSTCPDLLDYWDSLTSSERDESISSFEFQAQLILEKIIMEVIVGNTCESGGYVQAVAIKNLCYAMCWRDKPFWDYVKSECGYLCCTRKTNYCRDSKGTLVQGDPYFVIDGNGDCVKQTFCWDGEYGGTHPQAAKCTQHDCFYEVNPNPPTTSDH